MSCSSSGVIFSPAAQRSSRAPTVAAAWREVAAPIRSLQVLSSWLASRTVSWSPRAQMTDQALFIGAKSAASQSWNSKMSAALRIRSITSAPSPSPDRKRI